MFGFLKKLLIKFIDNSVDSVKITDTDWEKYRQEVFYSAKNKRNFLIGNFSFKGFNYIFDALIENTESESSMVRNDMNYNGFFKACTNFYDYEMVNKLMSLIEKIDM